MPKLITITLLVFLMSFALSGLVFAMESDPKDGCPDGFVLHPVMDHDDHHDHLHVGTDTDQNGNGFICVKHVSLSENVHVHIDDLLLFAY